MRTRISNDGSFVLSKVMPVIFLVIILNLAITGVFDPFEGRPGFNLQVLFSIFGLLVFFRMFRGVALNIANSVFIDGHQIEVNHWGKSNTFSVEDIEQAHYESAYQFPVVTLSLKKASSKTRKIQFIPEEGESGEDFLELMKSTESIILTDDFTERLAKYDGPIRYVIPLSLIFIVSTFLWISWIITKESAPDVETYIELTGSVIIAVFIFLGYVLSSFAFGFVIWIRQRKKYIRCVQRSARWIAGASIILMIATYAMQR